MTLLSKIKSSQLQARKNREANNVASLTTLIGEAEAIGKNNGNREVTDVEVVALIKKFIKNNQETFSVLCTDKPENDTHEAGIRRVSLSAEKELYESFLPQQMTEDELFNCINHIITDLGQKPIKMGDILKALKESYGGQYDGALASKIVKRIGF